MQTIERQTERSRAMIRGFLSFVRIPEHLLKTSANNIQSLSRMKILCSALQRNQPKKSPKSTFPDSNSSFEKMNVSLQSFQEILLEFMIRIFLLIFDLFKSQWNKNVCNTCSTEKNFHHQKYKIYWHPLHFIECHHNFFHIKYTTSNALFYELDNVPLSPFQSLHSLQKFQNLFSLFTMIHCGTNSLQTRRKAEIEYNKKPLLSLVPAASREFFAPILSNDDDDNDAIKKSANLWHQQMWLLCQP